MFVSLTGISLQQIGPPPFTVWSIISCGADLPPAAGETFLKTTLIQL